MTLQSLPAPGAVERARSTWLAMRRLYDARRHLYDEPPADTRPRGLQGLRGLLGRSEPARRDTAALWPFANAWAATRALASLGGEVPGGGSWPQVLSDHLLALPVYALDGGDARDPGAPGPLRLEAATFHPPGGRGDAYFDDNAWVVLDLEAHAPLAGAFEHASLGLARRVLDFVLTGWCDDPAIAKPGGIRWADPQWSRSRNTCSNGPAAEACVLAYLRSGEESRLESGRRIVCWVDATLRAKNGLYLDHVDPDGTLDRTLWAYNQGTMIGAGVLLHQATGEARHLDEARATAAAAASWLSSWDVLVNQPPAFLAIYLRNLLLLGQHAEVSEGVEQVARYAEWAWEHERAEPSGWFRRGELKLNRTAGMASLYALLAGATPAP